MSDTPIYLDSNATTRIDPLVLDAMLPLLREDYGNPSSVHQFGAKIASRIEEARSQVAGLIAARDTEIVFTSGGTEANNAAIFGSLAAQPAKRHVVITQVEHSAVLDPGTELERRGYAVSRVGVDSQGRLDREELTAALRPDTALISVMLANNETGVVFPLAEVVAAGRSRNIPVHTDAVNAVGKMSVNVEELGVSLLSLSGHKIHGPKGVGALYIRRGTPFHAQQLGGPQERQRRGGTLNAPSIVGLGAACARLAELGDAPREAMRELRDRLEREIVRISGERKDFPAPHVIGADAPRLPNTSCICFADVAAEAAVLLLSEAGICVSSGAACSSGSLEPSHVLQAMHIPAEIAQGQIRFSFSRFSTQREVDQALAVLPDVLRRVAGVAA